MGRHAWRIAGVGLVSVGWSVAAAAQVSGVGRAQWPSAVRASVPAVAVVTATVTATAGDAPRLARWRAVLRTGANDRHRLRVRGVAPGWTVRVIDGPSMPASSVGADRLVLESLARGYHDIVLQLDGPAGTSPDFEAVVETVQVPGGLAVVPLAAGVGGGKFRRP